MRSILIRPRQNASSGPLEFNEFLERGTTMFQAELATVCQACELHSAVQIRSIIINCDSRLALEGIIVSWINSTKLLLAINVFASL